MRTARPHAIALLVVAAGACAPPGTRQPEPHVVTRDWVALHPAPALSLGPLRPVLGTFHFVVLKREPGDTLFRPFGRLLVQRRTEVTGASAVVRNVAHYEWISGKTTVDTTVSVAKTLAPVSERTHTPSRIVMYDFRYLRATGRIGPADSVAPIDDTLPQAAFNSTDLDMLVTALPLDTAFHAALPLYDPEYPGFRVAEVRVTGTESVATPGSTRLAWILAVAQPSRPDMYYRVDVQSHAMLRKDFGGARGPWFRVQ